jgi:hypothetical protein
MKDFFMLLVGGIFGCILFQSCGTVRGNCNPRLYSATKTAAPMEGYDDKTYVITATAGDEKQEFISCLPPEVVELNGVFFLGFNRAVCKMEGYNNCILWSSSQHIRVVDVKEIEETETEYSKVFHIPGVLFSETFLEKVAKYVPDTRGWGGT